MEPRACADSAPEQIAHLHDHPGARNEEEFIFWTRLPWKTSVVCAAPGGHVGICGSSELPQAVFKPGSPWSGQPLVAMSVSKSLATTGGQVDFLSATGGSHISVSGSG